jgi:tRNA(Ile)-lysidine synthase
MAARRLRYEWWESLADEKQRATGREVVIAVGHHRDDSIETLLMNLMRGTGIKGLVGIPATNGRIVRPLLHLSRADILAYLDQHHLSYITDSSNLECEATRNKIRNLLLPLMEQINPNARQGIQQTIQFLQQTQRWEAERLDQLFADTRHCQAAGVEWDEWTVPAELSSPETLSTLFHHWSERHANAVMHNGLFYTAIPDISSRTYPLHTETLPLPAPPFSSHRELFDLDQIQLPLSCRHWREGDRLQPLGMQGTKLVSDLFTNAHFSPNRKASTWLVVDASDRILWVVGLRVADWSKLTDATRHILAVDAPV